MKNINYFDIYSLDQGNTMKNNENKKKMNAVQYMKHFEETKAMMEAIGDKVDSEQKALMEAAVPDTNEKGIFEMGNLLDVNTIDTEANQPRIYNSPVQSLSDGDKSVVADDFAQMLMNMKADTVDLEQIGPMSTAIGMKHGIVTGVEDFIRELINTAVEKQDSQGIALGQDEVPGVEMANEEMNGGMPEMMSGMDVAVVTEPIMDVGMEPELSEVSALGDETASALEMPEESSSDLALPDAGTNMDLENPAAPMDEVSPEGVSEELPLDVPEALGSEVTPEEVKSEKDDAAKAGELEDMAKADGNDEAAVIAGELKEKESDEAKDLESKLNGSEEKPEESEESEEDEEPKLEAQLESIKEKFNSNKEVTNKLQVIKENFLESQTPVIEASTPVADVVNSEMSQEPVVEQCVGGADTKPMVEEADTTSENDAPETEEAMVENENLYESAKAQLESIAAEYHAGENAKLEAEQRDRALDAKLESIVTGYHAVEAAKVEAVEKEVKVTAQLESIAAEYHDKTKKAKLESVQSRTKAAERIKDLIK